MEEQNITSLTEQFPPKKKLIIIAAIVGVVVIAFVMWLILKPAAEPEPQPEPRDNGASVLPESQQIAWQVFVNPKFGYAFKYPKEWALDKSAAEKDLANNIGGQAVVSSKPDPLTLLQSADPPSDLAMMMFTVYQVDAKKTVDEFIKDKKYGAPFSQASVGYAGISGKQLLYTQIRPDKREVLNIVTILKKDARIYVFSYNSFKPEKDKLPPEVETIHDEILSSFSLK